MNIGRCSNTLAALRDADDVLNRDRLFKLKGISPVSDRRICCKAMVELPVKLGKGLWNAQGRDSNPHVAFPPYIAYRLLRLIRLHIDFRSHLSAPSAVKDEPKNLSYSIASNCPTCADGEQ